MALLLASLFCGFVFGWGLLISGMVQPTKVLGFLDIFGAWDPSLAVTMGVALVVCGFGYTLARQREKPVLATWNFWPRKADINRDLVVGLIVFGIGWGLVGLCPGPALEDIATLSPRVLVFVIAMGIGAALHNAWQRSAHINVPQDQSVPLAADG